MSGLERYQQWVDEVVLPAVPDRARAGQHVHCPNPAHADRHPSFRISEQGIPQCTCGPINFHDVARWLGLIPYEDWKQANGIFQLGIDANRPTTQHTNSSSLGASDAVPIRRQVKGLQLPAGPHQPNARLVLADWNRVVAPWLFEWLVKRGVTPEAQRLYQLGTLKTPHPDLDIRTRGEWLFIPVFDEDRAGRFYLVDGDLRNLNPRCSRKNKWRRAGKSDTLFNLAYATRTTDTVLVTESKLDAMAVCTAAVAVTDNPRTHVCVATPIGIGEDRARAIFSRFRKVCLLPDNDEGGNTFAERLVRSLRPAQCEVVFCPGAYKDVGEFFEADFDAATDWVREVYLKARA